MIEGSGAEQELFAGCLTIETLVTKLDEPYSTEGSILK